MHNLKEKICVCHLYESCLEEYFCEFDAPDAFWTVTDYRKEAVPNYCCVCVFVNEYSALWVNNVKRDPSWLTEFFVLVNTDLLKSILLDVCVTQNCYETLSCSL